VTPEFVTVGDDRLEVLRIAPERTGAMLVFLHEGLGSIAAWRDFPRAVADQLSAPALVYSRKGYGRSSPLTGPRILNYLQREAWDVLPALLAALKVETPVLVGHSDGGSIALLYAMRFEPSAIAVMAPHVFVEDVTVAGVRVTRETWNAGALRERLARVHDDPDGAFLGWNDAWLDPAFIHWNIEADLSAIRCPVLAIQGVDDQYGTMEQLDRIAHGVRTPCTLLKLDQCGHSPQRDQPQAVTEEIARLYSAVTGAVTAR
jgi:pimeloyl-ACP methyl ester carboxylesterase